MQPLTHHQILALVGPFTLAGRQVDLAASQREKRRLAFRPVEHPALPGQHPALTETLWLQAATDDGQPMRLTRELSGPNELRTTLEAEGPDAGTLLARLAEVPLGRQWRQGGGAVAGAGTALAPVAEEPSATGWTLALSHRVVAGSSAVGGGLQPTQAQLQLDGWRLTWTPPPVHSRLGELRLAADGQATGLPEDLLAVLGHAWTRLEPRDGAWLAYLRQRGNGLAAFASVEQRLVQTAEHLARTLAAPPSLFHQRHRWARWRVTARRSVPALLSAGLVGGAAAVPQLSLAPESVMRMLILNAPPLLLIGFFCLREVPRIEIPPVPRGLRQVAWRAKPAGEAAAAPPAGMPTH